VVEHAFHPFDESIFSMWLMDVEIMGVDDLFEWRN
jgi:hypothetical protein